jgi:sugar phosphate isomerase/epimerase
MSLTRRRFLTTTGLGLAAAALRPTALAAATADIKSPLNGPIGLQLWSLRESLPKDLPGTLAKVRAFGFREVEGAGLWGQTLPAFRSALDAAGLTCRSAHMGLDRLNADAGAALAEAKGLGATWVICPWIPHDKTFTADDAKKAADAFNKYGAAAKDAGLRFGYHCHGYEFVPSKEGTLFDTLAGATDPKMVAFQIDVFHAFNGGADPVKLIQQHGARVVSLHLKDRKKGVPVVAGAAGAEADVDVPVGTGGIDYPAVLRAAIKAGTQLYYVEDESADPYGHIPQSLAYLQAFKP